MLYSWHAIFHIHLEHAPAMFIFTASYIHRKLYAAYSMHLLYSYSPQAVCHLFTASCMPPIACTCYIHLSPLSCALCVCCVMCLMCLPCVCHAAFARALLLPADNKSCLHVGDVTCFRWCREVLLLVPRLASASVETATEAETMKAETTKAETMKAETTKATTKAMQRTVDCDRDSDRSMDCNTDCSNIDCITYCNNTDSNNTDSNNTDCNNTECNTVCSSTNCNRTAEDALLHSTPCVCVFALQGIFLIYGVLPCKCIHTSTYCVLP